MASYIIYLTDDRSNCERCNADRFTWLPCICFMFCRKVLNCAGLKDK